MYKAFYTYSITNKDSFPLAGNATPGGLAIGFAEGDRSLGTGATLADNVTANLWMTVRDGSTGTKQFICPESSDQPDELTDDGTRSGSPVSLLDTYDFSSRSTLSYSMINAHHSAVGDRWNAAVKADWVIMADNSNNDYSTASTRHTLTDGASETDIRLMENTTNHSGEGQNILFGDGHVEFAMDPFQGPGQDNVFAMTVGGKNAPPTMGHDDGDAATDPMVAERDVVLLPLSGNGGGAGSLDPTD